jgi:hypothetical protein
MNLTRLLQLITLAFGFLSAASGQYTPTISGVNAFWWLGPGIQHDGPGCGQNGWCFYAQTAWTANPNGAPGTPSWTITMHSGGGEVTLNCYTCTNVTATAQAPSDGCQFDVTVTVSYGPYTSAPFNVLINTGASVSLASGYPDDFPWFPPYGYQSKTGWTVQDLCGETMQQFDANELLGNFTNDVANNWTRPVAMNGAQDVVVVDTQGEALQAVPASEEPQSSLTNTKVYNDLPWTLSVFSLNSGSGVNVHEDTQQFYQDHGRHF